MSAKGVMVNPLLMAHDYIAAFDRAETPERTEQREGYVWFTEMTANPGQAILKLAIRDFDRQSFARRKRRVTEVAEAIADRYPTGRVSCSLSDTYGNIADSLGDDRRPVDRLLAAMKGLGVEPKLIPMRGGTDGAALSARGLPTPNFFTGAYNFHSRFEFCRCPPSRPPMRLLARCVSSPSEATSQLSRRPASGTTVGGASTSSSAKPGRKAPQDAVAASPAVIGPSASRRSSAALSGQGAAPAMPELSARSSRHDAQGACDRRTGAPLRRRGKGSIGRWSGGSSGTRMPSMACRSLQRVNRDPRWRGHRATASHCGSTTAF